MSETRSQVKLTWSRSIRGLAVLAVALFLWSCGGGTSDEATTTPGGTQGTPKPTPTKEGASAAAYEVQVVDYDDTLPASTSGNVCGFSLNCRDGWHLVGIGIEVTYKGGGPVWNITTGLSETGVIGCVKASSSPPAVIAMLQAPNGGEYETSNDCDVHADLLPNTRLRLQLYSVVPNAVATLAGGKLNVRIGRQFANDPVDKFEVPLVKSSTPFEQGNVKKAALALGSEIVPNRGVNRLGAPAGSSSFTPGEARVRVVAVSAPTSDSYDGHGDVGGIQIKFTNAGNYDLTLSAHGTLIDGNGYAWAVGIGTSCTASPGATVDCTMRFSERGSFEVPYSRLPNVDTFLLVLATNIPNVAIAK